MVGIGGSIIKYPMLLYIPSILGFAAFTAHEVSGISAIQVFFATIGGVWAYRKGGYLNKQLIIYMGASILIGSFIGGFGSRFLSEGSVNFVYAILATIAVVMMFLPKKGLDDQSFDEVTFNKMLALKSSIGSWYWSRNSWCSRSIYFSADYVNRPENSYTNDNRIIFSDYIYIIDRFDSR